MDWNFKSGKYLTSLFSQQEPNNLTSVSSYRYSGVVHKKTVGVVPAADKNGFTAVLKKGKYGQRPAKNTVRVNFKAGPRRSLKKLKNLLIGSKYRKDLTQVGNIICFKYRTDLVMISFLLLHQDRRTVLLKNFSDFITNLTLCIFLVGLLISTYLSLLAGKQTH